jgi:AAA domain
MDYSAKDLDDAARRRVLECVLHHDYEVTLVDSPPGAGKTTLVEDVAVTAAHHCNWRVAVVTPRVEQAYDLVRRVIFGHVPTPAILLHASQYAPSQDVVATGVVVLNHANQLPAGRGVVVGTAAKFLFSTPVLSARAFDLLICDEAYQLPWGQMSPLVHLARRLLLVGDPGQLPPLVRGDIARFEAAASKVHWPAPKELLRLHPQLPVIQLPLTFRLPQDSVDFVQPSFYSDLPFVSAARPKDRRIRFAAGGMATPIDRALDLISTGASIVGILLPERTAGVDEVDEDVASLAAEVVDRLLTRRVEWIGRRVLAAADIGYVDAHVASNAAVERSLRRRGISTEVLATTPEIWQGLERPVMVMKHPLSGTGRFDRFSLEPGRLCVMTSRHQTACVIVGRDGVDRALAKHQHNCAERPSGAEDAEWTGWRAHDVFWSELEQKGRLVRA